MTTFEIGVGKADITSQIVGHRFFGYGEISQVGEGLEQRLYARAFIVRSGDRAWVYVICDLGMMSRRVRRLVEERVREKFGGRYPLDCLCLAVTHTHSAPGGYSEYFLYNLTILGYSERVTTTIVEGIVAAIAAADAALVPGSVGYAVGSLRDASMNRMLEAYAQNPPEERALYETPFDDRFLQLHFRDRAGKLRGLLNWFAVHGTSHDKKNRLVSPDNKGYAAWKVEQELGIIAGFALANHADISPNRVPTADGRLVGEGDTTRESCEIIGTRQAEMALSLARGPDTPIEGGIEGRLVWVDMRELPVPAEFSSTQTATRTAPALLGQNFIAGTEDGRGPAWFDEGAERQLLVALVARFTAPLSEEVRAIHAPKDPFVLLHRPSWDLVPAVLPIQLLTLGPLAFLAVPFELTTMAGRRLRRQLVAALRNFGVRDAVPISMANAYAGYTTTPEEYGIQHYEGASTLFGREQLGAVQGVFSRLAAAIGAAQPAESLPPPTLVEPAGRRLDTDPTDGNFGLTWFGDVAEDAEPRYVRGDTVEVTFWAGHPTIHPAASYMSVEYQVGTEWIEFADDRDFSTRIHYTSVLGRFLRCTCSWTIGREVPPGTWRIVHNGTWSAGEGKSVSYTGVSRAFEVDHLAASIRHRPADPPPALVGIKPYCRPRALAAGEVVIREGDEDRALYLVERGSLLISREGLGLDQLGPGETAGEMGLFTAQKRAATVTAAEPTELLVLDREAAQRMAEEAPAIAAELEQHALLTLARRLRRVDFILGQVGQAKHPAPAKPKGALLSRLRSWVGRPAPELPSASEIDAVPVLAESRLFHGLRPGLLADLAALFERRAVSAGTALCTQGERESELYLVLEGEVEVLVADEDDRASVQRLAVLGRGEAFGLTALVDGRPRMASCVARGPAALLVMSRARFEECLPLVSPEAMALRRALIGALADQVQRTNDHLVASGWRGLNLAAERAALEAVGS
ncbi:MAG: neutral/alkaline non-lysosomal ceramidase N-terminal domain-containing protein [Myxococcota bacterium]